MDLIYTNTDLVDQGVLSAYDFDLSFGLDENNFELVIGTAEAILDYGSIVYMENTEYGGVVDAKKTKTNSESIIYRGRTWHGILNSKVIEPDPGEDYFVVSGDANEILRLLVDNLGLSTLFTVKAETAGIYIPNYKFHRYCKCYDGIADMLSDNGAKLKIMWNNLSVQLSAVPIDDYANSPLDGDIATLTVEQCENKVNHLVCLGRGELSEREVIHLFVDSYGNIGYNQVFRELAEFTEIYENSNSEDLESDGVKKLKELLNNDKAEITLSESDDFVFDIGDIVTASDVYTGIYAAAPVTQKIVRINNGAVSIKYKTGR